jgi:hypothetical protein
MGCPSQVSDGASWEEGMAPAPNQTERSLVPSGMEVRSISLANAAVAREEDGRGADPAAASD